MNLESRMQAKRVQDEGPSIYRVAGIGEWSSRRGLISLRQKLFVKVKDTACPKIIKHLNQENIKTLLDTSLHCQLMMVIVSICLG